MSPRGEQLPPWAPAFFTALRQGMTISEAATAAGATRSMLYSKALRCPALREGWGTASADAGEARREWRLWKQIERERDRDGLSAQA